MRKGETCVCYLQGALQANQPRTSRHLAYLKKAGLVEARREGKWMYYGLKKTDRKVERILGEVFAQLDDDPRLRDDMKRLEKICCSPSRYGFATPTSKAA